MPPDLPQALSLSDWAAIRAAYEAGRETPVQISRRYDIHHFAIYSRIWNEGWLAAPPPPPHIEIAQRDIDVVLPVSSPLKGGGGGNLEDLYQEDPTTSTMPPTSEPDPLVFLPPSPLEGEGRGGGNGSVGTRGLKQPPAKTKRTARPKQQGMIDRLYRVIDNNLSQLEEIMKHQSDPSIADNEKETRTIGTVIGNIEKLKGLEDDAGKSRANKSAAPTNHAAETERLGRELAERLVRLSKDLRA